MYLFDTDVLSSLLKRVPPIDLVARFAAIPVGDQATSSITVGELIYGAERVRGRNPSLRERIETLLLENLRIESFDAEAARRYGLIRAQLESDGNPIGDADLRIASIAICRGLILVTNNTRHFSRVPGLALENWLE